MSDMVQNVLEKIAEHLDFAAIGSFIREKTEAAVRGYSGTNLLKTTHEGVPLY